MDTADTGGSEKHRFRPPVGNPAPGGTLVGQIKHCIIRGQVLQSPRVRRRMSAKPTMPLWPAT